LLVTRYTREVLNSVKERGGLITEVINELHVFVRDFPSGDTCGQRENDVTGEAPTWPVPVTGVALAPNVCFIAGLRGSAEVDTVGPAHRRWCRAMGSRAVRRLGVAVTQRLDRFQQKHSWAGFPLAVIYKYFDDFGAYLAALLTYYGFVSLFPLLLLVSTILGFILSGDPRLQHEVLTSALHQFPVIGGDLAQPKRLGGGPVGLAVGIAGCLYGGLGVAQAFQYATNTVWGVPRNTRPNPFKARGRSLVLLAIAGLAVLGTTVLSIVGGGGAGALGAAGKLLALAASVAVNIAVSIFTFRFAPARRLSVRDVVPGAIAAALIWQLLQSFGVIYVRHVVEHASATNAVFALVLGLLAFLYITATAVLLCVEIDVVRVNRVYPRSLLTPFTDNVTLTAGDRRSYSGQAKAQRSKGFEHVDVSFDPPSPEPEEDNPSA
jgi:membrane protein